MKVKDAMHEGADTATSSASVVEIAGLMKQNDVGAIPVVAGSDLLGIVTDRDIVCRALASEKSLSDLTAKDIMSDKPFYCRDDEDVGDAVHLMENEKVRRLPVLNDDDKLVGMLTLGDVAHAMSQDLTGELTRAVSGHHEDPQLLSSAS